MGRQAKKSKTRVYFCQTCAARHSAPTGAKCERGMDDADERLSDVQPDVPERPEKGAEGGACETTVASSESMVIATGSAYSVVGKNLSDTELILKRINELHK